MKQPLVSSLVLIALSLPAVPASAAGVKAPTGTDWVLVKLKAGPSGAENVYFGFGGLVVDDNKGVNLFGWGSATSYGSYVNVSPLPATSPLRITTTSDAGSYDMTLVPGGGGWQLTGGAWAVNGIAANTTSAMVLFVAGRKFDPTFSIGDVSVTSGSVERTVTWGSGSKALLSADPNDSGTAISAGPVHAGGSTHVSREPIGIAGAFTWSFTSCVECKGSWSSPDGRSRSLETVLPYKDHFTYSVLGPGPTLTFAGPAGDWSWSFEGEGVSTDCAGTPLPQQPVYAGYAPIGDDWTLFTTPIFQFGGC